MIFRKTKAEDIPEIMKIVCQAQEYFKSQGIPQWQDGYPDENVFKEDIRKNYSYVCEENGKILGTMAVVFDGEPDYDHIYEGQWLTGKESYAAIHRVAVDEACKGRGIAGYMIQQVEAMCHEKNVLSIRNDTHRKNLSMQALQKKNGFTYCGIIYLKSGAERIAFEKLLKTK